MISGPCKSQIKNKSSGPWKPMMSMSMSHGSAKCPNKLHHSSTMLSRRSTKINSGEMMMNTRDLPSSYSNRLEARISRKITKKCIEDDRLLKKLKKTRSLNSHLEHKIFLMMRSSRLRRASSRKCTKNLSLSISMIWLCSRKPKPLRSF